MDLASKLLDARQAVLLYGTTPPRLGTPEGDVVAAADKLAARLAGLPLDGVVVYDIQDETGRTARPRPFPLLGTVDPRAYAIVGVPVAMASIDAMEKQSPRVGSTNAVAER